MPVLSRPTPPRREREPIVPPRWAALAAELLSRGELAVLPGSPHNSVYSAANRLASAVEDFLARVG